MKIFHIVFTLLLALSISAQDPGIQWIDNDLDSALKQGNIQDKMIFVYAYTTWCGPCKVMKKKVFPDAGVGKVYNKSYVNVKIDMEKGQGFDLSSKYNITAYPTFLFLDKKGKVIHRSMGGRDVYDFVDLGNAAMDPDRQITTLHKRYADGDREPSFLKQYAKGISEAEFSGYEPITNLYLKTQPDWTTPENMKFLFDYSEADISSNLFQYTLENRAAFEKLLGKEKVNAKIEFAAERGRTKAGISRDDIEKLKKHYQKYYTENEAYHQAMQTYFKQLMYSRNANEQEAFKSEIQLYLAGTPDLSWNFYNSAAWQVYELSDNENLLSKAADWTLISISKQSNRHNNDTMAHILFKIGDKNSAQFYAEESIRLAKLEGADYSDTKKLLEQF